MKRGFIKRGFILVSLLGLSLVNLLASGFLIYQQGAAAMGLGGAFIALANDPSALFYNPAGLAFLSGTQVSINATIMSPAGSMELPQFPVPQYKSIELVSQLSYFPAVYFSHKMGKKLALGFGFYSPYGLNNEWPEDHLLRDLGIKSYLKTYFFNPSLAYQINSRLALSFGFFYVCSNFIFKRMEIASLAFINPMLGYYLVPMSYKASGRNLSLNAGLLFQKERFSFGFSWRGGFNLEYKGDIALDWSKTIVPATISQILPQSGKGVMKITYPHLVGFGFSFGPTAKIRLSADFNYILWSCYQEFFIEHDLPISSRRFSENWKNSISLRGGVEIRVTENLILRMGGFFDQTPQPRESIDPIIFDSDRVALAAGFSLQRKQLRLDLAYQYEFFDKRTSPNRNFLLELGKGIYHQKKQSLALNLGFVF